jgi:hypothetical protein
VIQSFRSQQLGLPRLPCSGAHGRRDTPLALRNLSILHLSMRWPLSKTRSDLEANTS